MPEIYEFWFDLKQFFKLFPKEDKELRQKLIEYEQKTEKSMAENRMKLFYDYGYSSEFDEALC